MDANFVRAAGNYIIALSQAIGRTRIHSTMLMPLPSEVKVVEQHWQVFENFPEAVGLMFPNIKVDEEGGFSVAAESKVNMPEGEMQMAYDFDAHTQHKYQLAVRRHNISTMEQLATNRPLSEKELIDLNFLYYKVLVAEQHFFEEWATPAQYDMRKLVIIDGDPDYVHTNTSCAWAAWKASRGVKVPQMVLEPA